MNETAERTIPGVVVNCRENVKRGSKSDGHEPRLASVWKGGHGEQFPLNRYSAYRGSRNGPYQLRRNALESATENARTKGRGVNMGPLESRTFLKDTRNSF